jgi:hypothetical protein
MPQKRRAQCRFCLEIDEQTNLIAPCICRGSAKFIHNHCLMRWYTERPDKGLVCGTCQETFTTHVLSKIEDIPFLHNYFLQYRLFFPLSSISLYHSVFYAVVFTLFPWYIHHPLRWYVIFQGCIHAVYFIGFAELVNKVQNPERYRAAWMERERLLLVALHAFFLVIMLKTYMLGGISANLCMYLYYYEHYDIVQKINQQHTFMFVSRPTQRRRLAS